MMVDYKATVFLPETSFPMKAGLPTLEPEILARWERIGLFARLREAARGREKFILHDGPPYANGHLHIGHALNKILKDVINRTQQMLGRDANYVPGWDCHGLPIEWKIEEKYRAEGKNKDEVPIVRFRRECRDFAEHWIDVQRREFERLGVVGDWKNPYTTMTRAAEAQIVRDLGVFVMNGSLYRGAKPVMWSPVERTALAEAEIEYHDHTSTTVFVRFPVVEATDPALIGAAVAIWTTTPWTMAGNRALAVGPDIEYAVVEVAGVEPRSLAVAGEKLVVAAARLEAVAGEVGIGAHRVVARLPGRALVGTLCRHPLRGQGYDFDVPVLPAAFATTEEGTGIVHIAPGHGADDWELGQAFGIEVPQTVDEDGRYYAHVPLFAGRHVFEVNAEVARAIAAAGGLLGQGRLKHRYPHSWRSKAPLIFRNTLQWFISMDKTGLRQTALAAIDATRFVPASGQNRLRGMIETRPDWCVSRQRAWGVPIAVFVSRETGEPLRDQRVLDRIVAAVAAEGTDVWFSAPPERFLVPEYRAEDFEQVKDILDVWFESGTTHAFVLEPRADLEWPASLYLEGSDQHRGWFHSSLLESCGTRGRAPYRAVLTHGFVMAEDGQKMSKSLGNVVSPQEVVERDGADILRLWVVGSDYAEDLRIGPEILKQHADVYRRLRNTLRFLLGNLKDFRPSERVEPATMPELERWVLHRLAELDGQLRKACDDLQFHGFFAELHAFCAVDLSAFYFDVRKDSLYCDPASAPTRRAARTVLDTLFDCLTAWLAPFVCFTAEQAWLARHPADDESVHLRRFPDVPAAWRDDALGARWARVREVRRVVTGALERARERGQVRSSLQAAPVIYLDSRWDDVRGIDWAEICITSAVQVRTMGESLDDKDEDIFALPAEVGGVTVGFQTAKGEKCLRCWKVLADVGGDAEHPGTCGRCADVVRHLGKAVA